MPSIRPGSSCVLPGDASPAVVLSSGSQLTFWQRFDPLPPKPAFTFRLPLVPWHSFPGCFRGRPPTGRLPNRLFSVSGAGTTGFPVIPASRLTDLRVSPFRARLPFSIRWSCLSLAGCWLPHRTKGPSDVDSSVRLRRRKLASPVLPLRTLSVPLRAAFQRLPIFPSSEAPLRKTSSL